MPLMERRALLHHCHMSHRQTASEQARANSRLFGCCVVASLPLLHNHDEGHNVWQNRGLSHLVQFCYSAVDWHKLTRPCCYHRCIATRLLGVCDSLLCDWSLCFLFLLKNRLNYPQQKALL